MAWYINALDEIRVSRRWLENGRPTLAKSTTYGRTGRECALELSNSRKDILTDRGGQRRVISLRKANRREINRYAKA